MHKNWNWRTPITDKLNRREQSRLQEKLSMKEKALRETQIRNVHEMGEMKRVQEVRVDE